jgi:hypothetical protein
MQILMKRMRGENYEDISKPQDQK